MDSNKQIVKLDAAEVFVRREGNILLNPVEAHLTLDSRKGHLYLVEKKWTISAAGYFKLNNIAAVNLVMPKSVAVDGEQRPNPFVERNPKTKAVESVSVRSVAIGRALTGNLVIIDKTLHYNLFTYFLQSLQAKMKRAAKAEARKAAKAGPAEAEAPQAEVNGILLGIASEKPDTPGRWVFYSIQEPVGVWADFSHPDVVSCLEEHVQRQKFGERIAQKILDRNLLRDIMPLGPVVVKETMNERGWPESAVASVAVYGWREFLPTEEIIGLAERADLGRIGMPVIRETIQSGADEDSGEIQTEARDEAEGKKE